jgi:hypothetical protein
MKKLSVITLFLLIISFLNAQNNCLDFDGTDDYVDCGNDASLNITSAITIETWINGTAGTVSSQTITLRPDQAGDENTWTSGTYSSVNDQSDATYLESSGGVSPPWQEGLFSTADHPAGKSGTINWVKVHIRYKDDATLLVYAKVRTSMKTNGTEYDGTDVTCSHSWANTYTEYTTNPATVSDWTWDDIDNIQIGADGQGAGTLALPVKAQVAEVWLEVSYTPPAIIVGKGTNAYELGIDTDSYIWGHINEQTVSSQVSAGWHHVALTYNKDAGSNQQKLYIDGVLAAQSILSAFISTNSNILKIGESFSGAIDEVRIWNDVRTEAEIRANMYRELINPTGEANLVAYYQFNETSGTNLPDESVNSNNGTLTNMSGNEWQTSPAFAGPKNCLDFDGSDDYVEVADDPSLYQNNTITVSAWIYPRNITVDMNWKRIIEKNSWVKDGWTFFHSHFYNPELHVDIDGDNVNSGQIISENQWQHITFTYNSTHLKIYYNGEEVYSALKSYTLYSANPLSIGHANGAGDYFNGIIDEVCIWNTALTARQIRENMCKTLVGDETGLIAYYNFDNTAGTTLQDFSGNANDGTLTNMDPATDWVSSSAFNTWLNVVNSTWSTTTNWSDGGVPTSTDNVGIVNYSGGSLPIIAGSKTAANANNLVINSDANLTVNSGGSLTVANNLYINSNSSGTGSLVDQNISGNITVSGTSYVQRFIIDDIYHYLSSPVSTQAISLLQSGTPLIDFDLFWYDEDYSATPNQGPTWINASSQSDNMDVGLGYAYNYKLNDRTLEFSGTINTGTISEPITYTYNSNVSTDPWYFGWNIVGNPYPSRINATTFIDDNNNIYGTLYFWDQAGSYNGNRNDYATWNKTGATAGGGEQTPNGYIDVGQAFMVHTTTASTSISFKNDMRVHDTAQFFKGEIQIFKISVENAEGDYNETLIGFLENTTPGFDNKYDGYKLKGNSNLALYTKLVEDDGYDYAIQGLPPLTDGVTVKLGIDAGSGGNYTFNVVDIINFHDTTSIFLEDLYEDIVVDLRKIQKYTFNLDEPGSCTDRFLLHFNTNLEVENNDFGINNEVRIYSFNRSVYIKRSTPGNFSDIVQVYNILGQEILNEHLNSSDLVKIDLETRAWLLYC